MMGTVNGKPKNIVTNVSVAMTKDLCRVMAKIHSEALSGAFTRKSEAVRRRDELVAEATLAEQAGERWENSASSSHNSGWESPED